MFSREIKIFKFNGCDGINAEDIFSTLLSAGKLVDRINLADVILVANPSRADLDKVIRLKRDYAEVVLYLEQIKGRPWCLNNKVKLLLTGRMSGVERDYRCSQFIEDYYMRLKYDEVVQILSLGMNSSPSLMWIKTRSGEHELVNKSFCEVVGKPLEDVVGKHHAYIWGVEEDDPVCIESEELVMSTRQTRVSEEVVQTSTGVPMYLTTYKSPVIDRDGTVVGTVGIGIDATKAHDLRESLIARNNALETLFKSMGCGILCYTVRDNQIIEVNSEALDILGYSSKDELIADDFDGIAHTVLEEDQLKMHEKMRTLHDIGDSVNVDYRVRRKNGSIAYVMGDIRLVRVGTELCYQRYLLDCTDSVTQAKEGEEFSKSIIEALSQQYDLVCYFDLSTGIGKPVHISDNFGFWGNTLEHDELRLNEFILNFADEYVHKDDVAGLLKLFNVDALESALEFNDKVIHTFRVKRGDTVRYFRWRAVSVTSHLSAHGVALGLSDVDASVRQNDADRVTLESALEQANVAARAKDAFLSSVTHDLRTPMNAIVNYIGLAVKHSDDKRRVVEYLSGADSSSKYLLNLIDNVLEKSRIDSGKVDLKNTKCWLPDLLTLSKDISMEIAPNKGLNFIIDAMSVTNEHVLCDSLRVQQILTNVMSNAVKYTGERGNIRVVLRELDHVDGVSTYEIVVEDDGIGMSDEFLSKIFDSFEREGNTTSQGVFGSGLGMTIVKNLVDMMGGTITVESKKNVGTKVTIHLSFEVDFTFGELIDVEAIKGKRALIVDDDFTICDSVDRMLTKLGMRVDWTVYGADARLRIDHAISREDPFSLYVVDYMLNNMNGIEVVKTIRERVGPEAVILLVTSYDVKAIRTEATRAGVSGFMQKPIFLSRLSATLKSLFDAPRDAVTPIIDELKPEENEKRELRILIVDDNEINRDIAVELVNDQIPQALVEEASGGEDAVEKIARSAPGYYSVVFMDIQMPDMDGYDATCAIRRLPDKTNAAIPVFAMTANTAESDREKAKLVGMNEYITKPIDIELIDGLLKTYFGDIY